METKNFRSKFRLIIFFSAVLFLLIGNLTTMAIDTPVCNKYNLEVGDSIGDYTAPRLTLIAVNKINQQAEFKVPGEAQNRFVTKGTTTTLVNGVGIKLDTIYPSTNPAVKDSVSTTVCLVVSSKEANTNSEVLTGNRQTFDDLHRRLYSSSSVNILPGQILNCRGKNNVEQNLKLLDADESNIGIEVNGIKDTIPINTFKSINGMPIFFSKINYIGLELQKVYPELTKKEYIDSVGIDVLAACTLPPQGEPIYQRRSETPGKCSDSDNSFVYLGGNTANNKIDWNKNKITYQTITQDNYVKGTTSGVKWATGNYAYKFSETGQTTGELQWIPEEADAETDYCMTKEKSPEKAGKLVEFYCENGRVGSRTVECKCQDGKCINGQSANRVAPSEPEISYQQQEIIPQTVEPLAPDNTRAQLPQANPQSAQICNGCLQDAICLPFGTRKEGKYCSIKQSFETQVDLNQPCENSYECKSNECSNAKCISTAGLLQKLLNWLNKFWK